MTRLQAFKQFLRDSPHIPTMWEAFGRLEPAIIPHVCISCGEETEKGRIDYDSFADRNAWVCYECFNTIAAVHTAWQRETKEISNAL